MIGWMIAAFVVSFDLRRCIPKWEYYKIKFPRWG